MRSFVITMPGLSVAKPGQIRSADELDMDDDQLDAFVEAGYAQEVFSEESEPRLPADVEHFTVDAVKAWVAEHPDEAAAVLEAEQARDTARVTLVDWLHTHLDDTGDEPEPVAF